MRILANRGAEGKGKGKPMPKEEDGDDAEGGEGGEGGAGKISAASLQPEDIIQLIPLRTGGKLKIAYPPGHAGMLASERDGMVKKNLEERVIKIELALVRIMKARGTLKQQELIAESTKQLVKFFKPDPRLMKKRIENLMERGFMRRDEEDQTLIHYQA